MGCTVAIPFSQIPALPGTLFAGTTALTDCSATFYDLKFPYTLTGNGFDASSRLNNVSYMFGASSGMSNLTGSIPNKLFYHGSSSVTKSYTGIADGTITHINGTDTSGIPYIKYTIVT